MAAYPTTLKLGVLKEGVILCKIDAGGNQGKCIYIGDKSRVVHGELDLAGGLMI